MRLTYRSPMSIPLDLKYFGYAVISIHSREPMGIFHFKHIAEDFASSREWIAGYYIVPLELEID